MKHNDVLFFARESRRFRLLRHEIYSKIFGASVLFVAGLIIMPAFLFNPNTQLRAIQFLFFWFLAWLSGKKNNPLVTITVMAVIVFFNLLVPYGQVLFSVARFKITYGALKTGVHRAVTLQGLFMLSRFTIRPDLEIPGAFGGILGESFRIFAELNGQKIHFDRKDFLGSIDRLMLRFSEPERTAPGRTAKSVTRPAGYFIVAVIALLSWLPVFFPGFSFGQ